MHELGVTFTVIKHVEQIARENNVEHISRVTLELGEVSTVIPAQLLDCWKWASNRSEILRGCELAIEKITAYSLCTDCNKEFLTVENGKTCPFCKGVNTYLVRGNEFIIKDVTVADE